MDDAYQAFLTKNVGNPRALRELQRTMANADNIPEQYPTKQPMPIDELEMRFDLIRQLESIWEDCFTAVTHLPQNRWRRFNDMQVAALLHMDIHILRNVVGTRECSPAPQSQL